MSRRLRLSLLSLLAAASLGACGDASDETLERAIAGADPNEGRRLIQAYGCGTCHTIDGIRGARGKVGPALVDYAQRHLLAGFLPNTAPNLVAWLIDPVALNPQTGMPAQGLTEEEARHIASYLYGLGESPRVYPPDPPLPLRGRNEAVTDLGDPVAPPMETTPRTLRIVPERTLRTPPG